MKYLLLASVLVALMGCKDCQRNTALYQDSYYKCMGTTDNGIIQTAWGHKHNKCVEFAEDIANICKD